MGSSLARRATLAGAASAAVALAVGELVGAMVVPARSLVGGVADQVIDRAPGGAARWAIDVFGTGDKAALLTAVVVVCLALGAAVGRWSLRWPALGPVAFGAFGLAGALAGVQQPTTSAAMAVLAAALAATAGALTLVALLRLARRASPPLAARPPAPPATATAAAPAPSAATAAAPPAPVVLPSEMGGPRRAFFGWVGAAGAFAALGAVGARTLAGRTRVEAARGEVVLPPPPTPTPALATGVDVAGLTPYVTPNSSFYRIDTALAVPQVDVSSWRLAVTGLVDRPFELTFDELLALPVVEEVVTLACVSNSVGGSLVGNARWLGVPLAALLDRAGVQPGADQVVGASVDGFTAGFPTEAAFDGRTALVAVGMDGEPLPVVHGFPARLVVAGLYGYVSATKWLRELRLTTWEGEDGYWIPRGWSKEGPVKTQSRIDVPRSRDDLPAGRVPVAGVAWAPGRGIARVEVQVDDGPWRPARLGEVLSEETWCQWVWEWDATPGDHRLRVRATDGTGAVQPERLTSVEPDGAEGWPTRSVRVL